MVRTRTSSPRDELCVYATRSSPRAALAEPCSCSNVGRRAGSCQGPVSSLMSDNYSDRFGQSCWHRSRAGFTSEPRRLRPSTISTGTIREGGATSVGFSERRAELSRSWWPDRVRSSAGLPQKSHSRRSFPGASRRPGSVPHLSLRQNTVADATRPRAEMSQLVVHSTIFGAVRGAPSGAALP